MLLDLLSFSKFCLHDCIAMQFTKLKIGSMVFNIRIWTISWLHINNKPHILDIHRNSKYSLSIFAYTSTFCHPFFFNVPYKSSLHYLRYRIPNKHLGRYAMVIFTNFLYYCLICIDFLPSSLQSPCIVLGLG